MEYDEGAFNQQEEIRARKMEHRRLEDPEDPVEEQTEILKIKESAESPWEPYFTPCTRPKKYMDSIDGKEDVSVMRARLSEFSTSFLAFFARNFYNFKSAALIISFLLNLILLSLRWESKGGGFNTCVIQFLFFESKKVPNYQNY